MAGGWWKSALWICTVPRLVGLRLHTLAVNAGEAVQRLAKGVERERLHVVFDVGPGLVGAAAREGAQLRGRHAHGAAAVERVLQPDLALPTSELARVLSVLTFCTR